MAYSVKPLACDPRRLSDLSERLIVNHYLHTYVPVVKRLNMIADQLNTLDFATASPFTIAGLKREELLAWNSMVLHEAYFASLGGNSTPSEKILDALGQDFGGMDRWHSQFTAMARAMTGSAGFVVLAWCRRDRRLVNYWVADYEGVPADAAPIMAIDMYEHAYEMDYGAKTGAYVDAFMRNINWESVAKAYRQVAGEARRPARREPPPEREPSTEATQVLDTRLRRR